MLTTRSFFILSIITQTGWSIVISSCFETSAPAGGRVSKGGGGLTMLRVHERVAKSKNVTYSTKILVFTFTINTVLNALPSAT